MKSIAELAGRLHLVLLHLPIGFLILAGVLAIFCRVQKTGKYRDALDLTVVAGAGAAIATAACGWLLAREGGYDEALLQRHQWAGFAAAGLATATWLLRRSPWYFPVLYVTIAVVILTGHFGGSLTHGADFLTEPFSQKTENENVVASDKPAAAGATAFDAYIRPILSKKCAGCHNPKKKKGGLLLDTPDGMFEGGKHGPVLAPGNPDSSELYRRIILPSHDEDRMPPKGKMPLSPAEIELLRTWIALGADISLPAMAMQPPEKAAGQNDIVFPPVQVETIDRAALEQLRRNRISAMPLGQDVPWLSVSLAGKKDLDPAKMALLKKVKNQLIHLDCSHSNLDDAMLAAVKEMPNVTRLNLSYTAVSSDGIKHLSGFQFIDYLNVTGTAIGDSAAETLSGLSSLRSLFTWNSRLTSDGIRRIKARIPALQIHTGATADTNATPLQLRPPKILFARNIFEDTVQVALDFPFKTTGLFYTLDATAPTVRSLRYEGLPLVFDRSITLRAIAAKDGWANSPAAQASFVKRKWKPRKVTLNTLPSPKYPGIGGASLADGILGETHTDKAFLGYEGEHLTAVLEFDGTIDFQGISVHYAENNGSWVFAPQGLHVWTSGDGKNWKPCIRARYPVPGAMQENKTGILREVASQPVKCRFLKVKVLNLLKNPKWHPGAGQKSWVFVDEILVE